MGCDLKEAEQLLSLGLERKVGQQLLQSTCLERDMGQQSLQAACSTRERRHIAWRSAFPPCFILSTEHKAALPQASAKHSESNGSKDEPANDCWHHDGICPRTGGTRSPWGC